MKDSPAGMGIPVFFRCLCKTCQVEILDVGNGLFYAGLNMMWSGFYDEFEASNVAYDYLIPAFVEYLMTVQPPYPYPPDPEVLPSTQLHHDSWLSNNFASGFV